MWGGIASGAIYLYRCVIKIYMLESATSFAGAMHRPTEIHRLHRDGGFTLLEILTVLVIIGVLTSLAVPSLAGQITRMKMHSVLNALRGDLFYARMTAVRAGQSAEMRFTWNSDKSCVVSYDIVELTDPERIVKKVSVGTEARGVCLRMNNANNRLVFNSRGLPSTVAARSFYASRGIAADSMRLSQAGRVVRF